MREHAQRSARARLPARHHEEQERRHRQSRTGPSSHAAWLLGQQVKHPCGCTPKRPCEAARAMLIEGNEEGLIEHLEDWVSNLETRDVYPMHLAEERFH